MISQNTVKQIIELSNIDKKSDSQIIKSDFFACEEKNILKYDEFGGKIDDNIFKSDKITITKEEYIEYSDFTNKIYTEKNYIHPTWSSEKIVNLFRQYLIIHNSKLD
jgi:hypothetical protein